MIYPSNIYLRVCQSLPENMSLIDRSTVHHNSSHTLQGAILDSLIDPNMLNFTLWEETRLPEENLCTRAKHIKSTLKSLGFEPGNFFL